MSNKRKPKQKPETDTSPAPLALAPLAPQLAALDDDAADVAAIVATFDDPGDAAPATAGAADQPPAKPLTVDELLAVEQRAIEGKWVRWPLANDAEFLLCDYVGHVQEQHRLERMARLTLEERAKKAGKEYNPKTPLQVELIRELEVRARFGRSIKGWRGADLAARPFNLQNFSDLWARSIDFRMFFNAKTMEIRGEIERETRELGKA